MDHMGSMPLSENVEIIRRAFQDAESGGFEAVAPLVHEDFEMNQIPNWPGAVICRGWEEAVRAMVEWTAMFDEFRALPEKFTAVGADLVVVDFHEWGRPRGGDVEVDQLWAIVFTLREGRIARWEWFNSPQEALRVANGRTVTTG